MCELDEAFFRELEELSCSKVLVLMGDYNDVNDLLEGQQQGTRDLGNCWRNMAFPEGAYGEL